MIEYDFTKAITEDSEILAIMGGRPVEQWWFQQSSIGLGEGEVVPPRPYIVWNEGPEFVHQAVRETSRSSWRTFRFYVYDHKGDFTRINQILTRISHLTSAMADFVTTDGQQRVSETLWQGRSQQITDDGWDSCCRYGSVRFTVSEAIPVV